ncbi:hypothetical protein [Paenibacillus paeoniae]|uniref:Uncharacterized protein n=1 Tax=Paenibacillus paeoniae TaxID=2292705 RepID=A0A371PJ35_9BACL|nr:hypothetical protein [Paenibacillus paeoniae]REK76226.1 hypothetical protein DX130_04005 [Paenibacillus paeoniae]
MRLQDALFNWLQIRLVADARQDDGAARDTLAFFEEILREDHGLASFDIERIDETMIHVRYEKDGRMKLQMYPRETGEQLLHDIIANPKYNEA